ncbi:DUF4166 domain-containing protein [Halobacillus salinarum]|uniref:DUF4166 domain-containing protein n=1 Tax=Halobacillus salinarum TaxID=2932257 RepID=A0ABY4ELC9_9BACI|nr:DUF4166 domain-containing protein [Halobacillus salinarum]UOQ45210.1 DUF4166 domain-containing protein [Halobacillus salinarum]
MTSIFHRALGEQFYQLHPEIQKKYGLTSKQNIMTLGQGRMTEIRGTPAALKPLLYVSSYDHIGFAERGKNIPFTMENYAYQDELGRETVSWVRRFFFPYAIRGHDAAMYFDERAGGIVYSLGKSGAVSSPLYVEATPKGGLFMQSEQLTFKEKYRLPKLTTSVYEHYDEEVQAYRVHMHAEHHLLGTMLMYEGHIYTEFLPMTYNNIPDRGIFV